MTVLMLVIGVLVYSVDLPDPAALLGFFLTAVVGAGAFAALGIALTAAIPSRSAAPAVTNAVVLPLYFISGIFVPADAIPPWVNTVGGLFPVKHLYDGLLEAFTPGVSGIGIAWDDLAWVVAWGVAGAAIALWTFRWTPSS
jgi:ABC-2 type transport system permease protein